MDPTENTTLLNSSSVPTGDNRSYSRSATLRKGAMYLAAAALGIMGVSTIMKSLGLLGCHHNMSMFQSSTMVSDPSNLREEVDMLGAAASPVASAGKAGKAGKSSKAEEKVNAVSADSCALWKLKNMDDMFSKLHKTCIGIEENSDEEDEDVGEALCKEDKSAIWKMQVQIKALKGMLTGEGAGPPTQGEWNQVGIPCSESSLENEAVCYSKEIAVLKQLNQLKALKVQLNKMGGHPLLTKLGGQPSYQDWTESDLECSARSLETEIGYLKKQLTEHAKCSENDGDCEDRFCINNCKGTSVWSMFDTCHMQNKSSKSNKSKSLKRNSQTPATTPACYLATPNEQVIKIYRQMLQSVALEEQISRSCNDLQCS